MSIAGRGNHLTANGIRQHYIEYAGDGPALVLIPGITSPAITWGFVAERLAETNHVYVFDVRGRGLSENRPGLSYRLEDCALDAKGAIEALGLDRPVVLGHSMGARIATKLAALAPARVGRLVIVDPPVSGPGRRPYPMALEWYLETIRAVAHGGGIEAVRKALPGWTEAQLALRVEWLPTCAEEAVAGSHRSFHEEDTHADMARVRCPTLLVHAGRGGVVSDEDADEIIGLISGARGVKIDNASHMIPWDDLDGFLDAVGAFIAAPGGGEA